MMRKYKYSFMFSEDHSERKELMRRGRVTHKYIS